MFYFFNIAFFILILLANSYHYLSFDHNKNKQSIAMFSNLIQLPGVVRSVGFYEDRFFEYGDNSKKFYVDIPNINYMRFSYEK
jgi:hypothetical protein